MEGHQFDTCDVEPLAVCKDQQSLLVETVRQSHCNCLQWQILCIFHFITFYHTERSDITPTHARSSLVCMQACCWDIWWLLTGKTGLCSSHEAKAVSKHLSYLCTSKNIFKLVNKRIQYHISLESCMGWVNLCKLQVPAFKGQVKEPAELCVQSKCGMWNSLCGPLNVDPMHVEVTWARNSMLKIPNAQAVAERPLIGVPSLQWSCKKYLLHDGN